MIDPSELCPVGRLSVAEEKLDIGKGCYGRCAIKKWRDKLVVEKTLLLPAKDSKFTYFVNF